MIFCNPLKNIMPNQKKTKTKKKSINPPNLGTGSPSLAQKKISVPDIRRHMTETERSEEFLREKARYEALKAPSATVYQHLDAKSLFNSIQTVAKSGSNTPSPSTMRHGPMLHASPSPTPIQQPGPSSNSARRISQRQAMDEAAASPQNQFKSPGSARSAATPPPTTQTGGVATPVNNLPVLAPPSPGRDHDDPSPMTERRPVVYERILSTAGQGIKRENEKMEAKMNINRLFTIGKLKSVDSASDHGSPKHSRLQHQNSLQLDASSPPRHRQEQQQQQQQQLSVTHSKHGISLENMTPMSQKQFTKMHSVNIAEHEITPQESHRKKYVIFLITTHIICINT